MEIPDYFKERGCGYTTGSCAAAAAKAAAVTLLCGRAPGSVQISLPGGFDISLDVESSYVSDGAAKCSVRKDSGRDPDVTNGMLIFASASRNGNGAINVLGGEGIGTVTKPGLSVDVGKAAINPVPMKMIKTEIEKACREFGYKGGLDIVISVPQGETASEKTYNPRLGVTGGISILGTSGIVEPMSEKAVTDTIYLEMRQRASLGAGSVVVSPGNYGRTYMKTAFGIDADKAVKCGNHIGEAVDFAAEFGFESLLLIGHAGKLVKLAAGVMNTHSKVADARMEIFALYAALCGAENSLLRYILDCVTCENAILRLQENGLLADVAEQITAKIGEHLARRAGNGMKTAAVVFTNAFGLFGKTALADELIESAREVY